jgi:dynein heavy chain
MASLSQFAAETIGGSKFKNLSLGQGQGNKAKEMILQGRKNGDWICLQNCHLAISWMETLEKLLENQDEGSINPYFRLWLTSLPSEDFSINVLQQGIKIVMEQPTGIKANLQKIYGNMSLEGYSGVKSSEMFQKLMFNLAFFHSALNERKKYGPLGFNISYDWIISDFDISQIQLKVKIN